MGWCVFCEQEMKDPKTIGCSKSPVKFPDGESTPQVPHDGYYDGKYYDCGDCGAKHGGFHHPGCDMERCPRCGDQLISCGCLSEDEDD
jgi:hypothetical protein